jgi:hypothetical protein
VAGSHFYSRLHSQHIQRWCHHAHWECFCCNASVRFGYSPPVLMCSTPQRKTTLLVEYRQLRKANVFSDKRLGGGSSCCHCHGCNGWRKESWVYAFSFCRASADQEPFCLYVRLVRIDGRCFSGIVQFLCHDHRQCIASRTASKALILCVVEWALLSRDVSVQCTGAIGCTGIRSNWIFVCWLTHELAGGFRRVGMQGQEMCALSSLLNGV